MCDKLLLTPGPLSISDSTKLALLSDHGSRDQKFLEIVTEVRDMVVNAIGLSTETYTCIPMQGSGTFAVESIFRVIDPRDGVLILINGAYGRRMEDIAKSCGFRYKVKVYPENTPINFSYVDLDDDINYIALVHHETTSGVINDLTMFRNCGRTVIVDAMSSMGGIPTNFDGIDFIAGSSGKCFEGPPGCGLIVAKKSALMSSTAYATSISLDLKQQYLVLESTKQFRFTPPTHVLVSLHQALKEHQKETIDGRYARYCHNANMIADFFVKHGCRLFVTESRGPIITTFYAPSDIVEPCSSHGVVCHKHETPGTPCKWWDFQEFYDALSTHGYVIYPGKVTTAQTFRIGSIGHMSLSDVKMFLRVCDNVFSAMKTGKKYVAPKIDCEALYQHMLSKELTTYVGVPDSLMLHLTNVILEKNKDSHIVMPNEGLAVSYASGYALSTGKTAVVYMQNSGIGNAVNPLLSLAHSRVYSTKMLLLIGWRGEPGTKDEPQHMVQGECIVNLLRSMHIPHFRLNPACPIESINKAVDLINSTGSAVAVLISKDTLLPYKVVSPLVHPYLMTRHQAQQTILEAVGPQDLVFCTTGKSSRELNELGHAIGFDMDRVFLTVGSMGHTSSLALASAMATKRRTWCLDGDGAALMHMGIMATIGTLKPKNLIHIVVNNGLHESVGITPTAGFSINLAEIAKGCGYPSTHTIETLDHLEAFLSIEHDMLTFVDLRISGAPPAGAAELSRPSSTPKERAALFTKFCLE